MIDFDTDVILIDSDDSDSSGGSSRRNSLNNKRAAASPGNTSSSSSSAAAALPSVAKLCKPSTKRLGQNKNKNNEPCSGSGSIVDIDDSCSDDDNDQSSSSSSSSGFPSPYRLKSSSSSPTTSSSSSSSTDRPPSVIHTKSPPSASASSSKARVALSKKPSAAAGKSTKTKASNAKVVKPVAKKKGLANSNNNKSKETKDSSKQPTRKPKKRQWGYNKKSSGAASKATTDGSINNSDSSSTTSIKPKSQPTATATKHYHCYLLRSLDPDHPLKTYIGFTTHPQRRIRQHNGILKAGGARRTKRSGRPWTFVCIIAGFQDKITALQFEWAWQNVDKSLGFREAVGDDALAKKMKRRYGPKARLDELRILLKESLPFCLYSLTVYFPERVHCDMFGALLRRGKDGNPYKNDQEESGEAYYEPLTNYEVCALENMPVVKEMEGLKEKKKMEREAKRAQQQQQQKKGGKKTTTTTTSTTTDYGSDISEWLENAKSAMEEESWFSDLLDDDDDDNDEASNCGDLNTIAEDNPSGDLCGSNTDDDGETSSAGIPTKKMSVDKPSSSSSSSSSPLQDNNDDDNADDISKDFLSLSIDPSKRHDATTTKKPDECDFSTISSADSLSDCCLIGDDDDDLLDDDDVPMKGRVREERGGKENKRPLLFGCDAAARVSGKDKAGSVTVQCDVVDLCDSP